MSDQIIVIQGEKYAVCQCGSCGVRYTVPEFVRAAHRRLGGFSYCSNCHQWGWSEGEDKRDEIRRERDRLKQEAARRDDEIAAIRREREAAEKRAAAAERKVKRVEKRAHAGLCPCCNRTFSELAKHIAAKHPTFRAEDMARENVVSLIKAKAS